MVEQHRHEAFRCRQIAVEKRDRACGLGQCVAQRKRVIGNASLLDTALGSAHCLIGKSLKPEDPRQSATPYQPLVKLKTDDMRPVNRGDMASKHALDVAPGIGLVSQIMQWSRRHSLAKEQIDRVGLVCSQAAEPLGERQRRPVLATAESAHPQPPERPQLILGVVEASRKFERLCPGRTGTRRPLRLHQ